MKIKKLSARGFSHVVTPLLVMVLVAIGGVAFLVGSHADPVTKKVNKPIKISSVTVSAPAAVKATFNQYGMLCANVKRTYTARLSGVSDGGHVSDVTLRHEGGKVDATIMNKPFTSLNKDGSSWRLVLTTNMCTDPSVGKVNVGGKVAGDEQRESPFGYEVEAFGRQGGEKPGTAPSGDYFLAAGFVPDKFVTLTQPVKP